MAKPKFRLNKNDNGTLQSGNAIPSEDVENDSNCNIIPLPPKDPRAVQQMTASKPRHQRKYPLVMPNSSGGGSTCQVAGTMMVSDLENKNDVIERNNFQDHITPEVSFDERIALELDALDQLGAVESPVSERQVHTFPVMQEPGCDEEENCEQRKTFDRGADVEGRPEHGRGLDCDEVRIMIKVLGTKVSGDQCLDKLRATGWDVHHAIKLAKLEATLEAEGYVNIKHTVCLNALENTNWDIVKAASGIIDNMMATINKSSILV